VAQAHETGDLTLDLGLIAEVDELFVVGKGDGCKAGIAVSFWTSAVTSRREDLPRHPQFPSPLIWR
jgi:hypothetical protein